MATQNLTYDNILPWRHDVDVFEQAVAQTNWNTVTADAAGLLNAYKSSTGVQNAEINFDVALAAGTWTFELMHVTTSNVGIYTLQFDGVSKGTIDGYSSTVYNVRSQITGIAVATTGKVRLKLLMATKNASAGGYQGIIQHIQLRRTDAGGATTLYAIDPDTRMPWLEDVNVFMTPIAHTNWNNNSVANSAIRNGYHYSSGVQNDEINFDVVLATGTWMIEIMHHQGTNHGIYTVALAGSTVGTIDGYASSAIYNIRSSITGITVVTTGKVRLSLVMATKNASSAGYYGAIQHIQLRRTA